MRDPARIPLILDRLRKVWEAHPDLRLGQLLVNASRPSHSDPFYIEDEALITRLEILCRPTVNADALNAELDRLIAGANEVDEQRINRERGNYTFEDGVRSAVATIRKKFGAGTHVVQGEGGAKMTITVGPQTTPSPPPPGELIFKYDGQYFRMKEDGSVVPFTEDSRPRCPHDAHVWQSRALGEYVWCMNCPARKDGR
jgi:hypothetical protein